MYKVDMLCIYSEDRAKLINVTGKINKTERGVKS